MSLCLRRVIIAYNRGHPAPSALRASNGSATHACTLEAMRTQGFSAGAIWMNSQSNSASHDQSIRRFIRRLALLLAFKQSLTFVTIWFFIWGAVALVLRAASAMPRGRLLWGAIGIAVAVAAAAA